MAGQIALELLKPDQHRLVLAEQGAARRDCKRFADAVLNRDVKQCDLMLDGLRHGVTADLTASQRSELQGAAVTVSGYVLLGLYCRGRAADLAASVGQIVNLTAKN
ncbi:MAG: hypothetical protein LBK76_04565 [Verrucomicrobiales bacterium]|nr:hypothetical protein [Verrucomicrobiales bacterium]